MLQKTIKYIVFGLLLSAILGFLYVVYHNQKELEKIYNTTVTRLKDQEMVPCETKVVEKVVSRQPWVEVQNAAKDTVVRIISQHTEFNLLEPYRNPEQKASIGSGFFINEAGEIVTNHHVIDEAKAIWIKIPSLGKAIIDVELVGTCPERDLALLRVTPESLEFIKTALGTIPYLTIGDSDLVKRSDEVLALGYPLGQISVKSTSGVVSGREHIGGDNLIQISAPINPGSSGGPALNASAQVIGITSSGIVGAQNVGYVIPSNELKMILDDLRACEKKENKVLRRPFLGILYNVGSASLAEYLGNPNDGGCYIVDVYRGSLLAQAGVQAGDVLYEVNGHKIDLYGDINVPWSEDKVSVTDYVTRLEIGQPMSVTVYRKGEKKVFNFKFGLANLLPIHRIFPGYDKVDYEIYAGMVLQQLTINHLPILVNNAPSLSKYTEFENQVAPAIIITHIIPNSQTQRLEVMRAGAVVTEVNGKKIGTLEQLRELLKTVQDKYITFKTSEGVFFVIDHKKSLADETRLSSMYGYPISPFMQSLLS